MRVYIPATVTMLRALNTKGEVAAVGDTAFALTPALRESYDVPVPVLLVMAVILGSIGGGIGRGLNRLMSASRPSFRT